MLKMNAANITDQRGMPVIHLQPHKASQDAKAQMKSWNNAPHIKLKSHNLYLG